MKISSSWDFLFSLNKSLTSSSQQIQRLDMLWNTRTQMLSHSPHSRNCTQHSNSFQVCHQTKIVKPYRFHQLQQKWCHTDFTTTSPYSTQTEWLGTIEGFGGAISLTPSVSLPILDNERLSCCGLTMADARTPDDSHT